ncbi:MAG: hypothetical protein AAB770_02405 [Patescibacteria group bacterium]
MINTNKVGLVFAVLFGGGHIVWSLFVLLGWSQPIVNFIFWAHMVQTPPVVGQFDVVASGTLIIFTAVLGYVVGNIVAIVWNKVHTSA